MGTARGAILPKGHIFLSHAGADTQAARQFAEILRRNGLDVWFDKDSLQPGDPWTATLEKAISDAWAMIVYIGSLGIQAWCDREVRFGLVRSTLDREAFRFIPVLGEGADPAKLPPFVQQHHYVDLRDRQRAHEQIRRLLEMLRKPSSSKLLFRPNTGPRIARFAASRSLVPRIPGCSSGAIRIPTSCSRASAALLPWP